MTHSGHRRRSRSHIFALTAESGSGRERGSAPTPHLPITSQRNMDDPNDQPHERACIHVYMLT